MAAEGERDDWLGGVGGKRGGERVKSAGIGRRRHRRRRRVRLQQAVSPQATAQPTLRQGYGSGARGCVRVV